MLNFTGAPGSGFEFCDPTPQTLTRGSQYQTSFLPEFVSGEDYQVRVRATYKDYLLIDFDLNVRYLPNLDGKTKFVDLGTHVFFKSNAQRPATNYKFVLHGVTDERVSDDQDGYALSLSHNGGQPYFNLEGQENVIEISDQEARTVPKIGTNAALVTQDSLSYDFHDAKRDFLALSGAQSTDVEIPLVAALKDGELAVVLTWHDGSKVVGNNVEIQGLDLHVEFQPTDTIKCTVDRFRRDCNGVKLSSDQYYSMGAVSHI